MLKYRYTLAEKETIPEAFLPLYEEKDGFLTLKVEGAGDAAALNRRVEEFRTNNLKLTADMEAIAAAATGKEASEFKGIGKDAIITEIQLAIDAASKAGSAKSKTEVEAAAEARVKALEAANARAQESNKIALDAARKELADLKIGQAVVSAASKVGLLPEAADDIIARANRVFQLNDKGQVVALKDDGTQRFDEVSGQPYAIEHFITSLSTNAKHFFKPSTGSGSEGGGAGGGNGGGGGGGGQFKGPNPWATGSINITIQTKLARENYAEACRLAALAGAKAPPKPAGAK